MAHDEWHINSDNKANCLGLRFIDISYNWNHSNFVKQPKTMDRLFYTKNINPLPSEPKNMPP